MNAVRYPLGIVQIGADPLLIDADSTRLSEPDVGINR